MDRKRLKARVLHSLRHQGFKVEDGRILPPQTTDKATIRKMHETAVKHRVEFAGRHLARHELRLLDRFAKGKELIPQQINPRLIEVKADSEDELLFRYCCLHWSIPVSSGYGRRLRFLVVDQQNRKLIGLFGLCDPVYSLAARDQWIGWSPASRATNLKYVMDAFVLGAMPPYSSLLCGKLVAMLAASNVVRRAFKRKYQSSSALISKSRQDGRLALITTTSALGRSSVYNRIRFQHGPMYHPVGFTKGSGEFHFANGLYAAVLDHAKEHCIPTAKQEPWGIGFRNRREVVKKCLIDIGLSSDLLYHGVQREIFCVPLAANSRDFLRGDHSRLRWLDHDVDELSSYFRERWAIPRSNRDTSYQHFDPATLRLW